MNNRNKKWWLAVVAICCLVPAAGAAERARGQSLRVPEGGSAAIYLLGAGLTCFGAMFLRSKLAKPTKS
jgi:hypothetical protein